LSISAYAVEGLDIAAGLNKTSMKPAGYSERFVKRHGLFCLALARNEGAKGFA